MRKFKKALAATMLTAAVVCTAGFVNYNGKRSKNDENMSKEETNGHDYVDLGLPSGTLWATCNVGADSPEDYGDYFAWGETTTRFIYVWFTYEYANKDREKLTKYCYKADYGNNGFTDKLTVLLAGDDAATANCGSGWRTPSKEEWEELRQNTTQTWTTQNGVRGIRFTASNDNNLFLPAAGISFEEGPINTESGGCYWSSSLFVDNFFGDGGPDKAWIFGFGSDYTYISGEQRCCGASVRPVRSAK